MISIKMKALMTIPKLFKQLLNNHLKKIKLQSVFNKTAILGNLNNQT
jgi:hypothetical protein